MKFVSIVGARPQFIKIAPLCRAIERHNASGRESIEDIIVHTGQHYDAGMSAVFFDELEIPQARYNLGVGSGPHGQQTGRMLEKIEQLLLDIHPDMVIIYGDTNSTTAGALAAVKHHIPVAHIEAGLRSFNRKMPEEINRIVADHVSDLLLAPTPTAIDNLTTESRTAVTTLSGDIMYDSVLYNRQLAARDSRVLAELKLEPGSYGVVTVHRAENTDGDHFPALMRTLEAVANEHMPLVFPVHPRTVQRLSDIGMDLADSRLRCVDPVGYLDMLALVDNARMVLTDSGGLQKEAFFLDCPCVTLREETEWVETVEYGGNIVVGTDSQKIEAAVADWAQRLKSGSIDFSVGARAAFGAGDAADRILTAILEFHDQRAHPVTPGVVNG